MKENRALLIGLAIALVSLCCCLLAAGVGAAAYFLYRSGGPLVLRSATRTPAPTRDPSWTAVPAPTPGPTEVAQMDAINLQVVAARGLQPQGQVQRLFLSADQVRQRTLQDFEEDTTPEEWVDTQHVYEALGLAPAGLDLHELFLRLYSEGIAGFYDPDTGELVVVSDLGALDPYARTTYAHEYNHALQDQNYDLRGMGFSDEGWDQDPERAAAVQALLEGDSTLLDEQYQATLTDAERREYQRIIDGFDVSIYYELPEAILRDFFFPYEQGLSFVRRYYDQGGWARVDEVWRDPPVSTEHILHPERYEAGDLPLPVARPALTDTLGSGWREIDRGVMGEWYTYLILAYGADADTRLSERQAGRAAEGWGGDSYTVFHHEADGQTVLALHSVWDTSAEAEEFAAAFRDYGDKRFGRARSGDGWVCWERNGANCLYTQGEHTLWLMAPDQATVDRLLELYPDF